MSASPTLSSALQEGIHRAFDMALAARHEYLTLEHLLLALQEDDRVRQALEACGVSLDPLREGLERFLRERLESLPLPAGASVPEDTFSPTPTLAFNRVMEWAILHALNAERRIVDGGGILAAILEERESHAAFLLRQGGLSRLPLLRFLSHGAGQGGGTAAPRSGQEPGGTDPREGAGQSAPGGEEEGGQAPGVAADPLEAYAVDLVRRAAEGRIDPLVGRDAELERMMHVLCRRRKNNPLLVGEAGVGKTALAEGLALRIHQGKVPDPLKHAPYYALDLGALVAGTRYRGDFEARVKGVLEALGRKPGALLFIDEIHGLVGAGSVSGGHMDASGLLKPALQSGELRCIGASTFQDLKGSFDKDRPLLRRFQKIEIPEPSEKEALAILKGLLPHYEGHHGVKVSDEALEAAVSLSARHLRDQRLPDKAIDVLDEAGAAQRLLPPRKRTKVLGVREVQAVVSRMARVPLEDLDSGGRERLAALEQGLKDVIYGQDTAVERLCASIKLARSGLRGADKPGGAFLFAGPTGVGKTELARQAARILGVPFLRFDMSEYMEKHAVSRLIGAPPGYVGFDDGGLLVDAVRKNPHAVLLLDEIEKAHADLHAILLQVMDHATLTDNHGRSADFRHIVLIMTTNAGARELSQRRVGFSSPVAGGSARGALERAFSPEFRNRLDAIIQFAALGRPEILKVVDKNLQELQGLLAERKVKLQCGAAARAWLADKGYDPAFGARPMARVIEERIKRPLADLILFGRLQKGGTARVELGADGPEIVARAR